MNETTTTLTRAEFHRSNTESLVAACTAFVQFARVQRLLVGSTVAIDGSKIRMVASRKAVLNKQRLGEQAAGRQARQIEQYLKPWMRRTSMTVQAH